VKKGCLAGLLMLAVVAAVPLILVASVFQFAGSKPAGGPGSGEPSALALADIPPEALAAYRHAATTVKDVPWWIIAAIGKEESDHGRSVLPGVHSGANSAGAMGPMQFLASTWARYKRDCGGGGNVYDIRDAACGTAAYLQALLDEHGGDMARALFGYNHAAWYVADILRIAASYYVQNLTGGVGGGGSGGGTAAGGNPMGCKPSITQGYGYTAYEHPHHGIDYSCAEGTPLLSVVEGTVVQSTGGCPSHGAWLDGGGGGYGNHLVIGLQTDVGAGVHKYFVLYAHMEEHPALDVGAQVKAGQVVGLEGSSGWSSGPHLHFEVDQDVPITTHSINPSPFVEPDLRVPTT